MSWASIRSDSADGARNYLYGFSSGRHGKLSPTLGMATLGAEKLY